MDRRKIGALLDSVLKFRLDPARMTLLFALVALSLALFGLPFSGAIAVPAIGPLYYPTPTPGPPPPITSIVVTASDITAHKAGVGGFATIVPGPVTFDLLEVGAAEEVLGRATLETGRYTQIRLAIDSLVVTLGGQEVSAKVPSGKLKLNGTFEVETGRVTTVTVDFDTAKALVFQGSGGIIFKPTALRLIVSQPISATGVEVQEAGLFGQRPFGRIFRLFAVQTGDGTVEIAVTDSSASPQQGPTAIPSATNLALIALGALLAMVMGLYMRRRAQPTTD